MKALLIKLLKYYDHDNELLVPCDIFGAVRLADISGIVISSRDYTYR